MLIKVQIQLGKGLSVQCWPGGHNGDSEDAIAFTERHNVECKIQKYPLSKAVEAYGMSLRSNARKYIPDWFTFQMLCCPERSLGRLYW